ncbi:hypothetical protein JTE90_010774 [Oedothorax gibbosus]|uniref:BESS domain-containing protein n=1 Tax=Oedothorax gibbosus TaxID=931172 RepID=A0AAV6TXJ3_9ARAC|nr:hypothetical protein JTE90_010774 [Oedothorax gibbosus]
MKRKHKSQWEAALYYDDELPFDSSADEEEECNYTPPKKETRVAYRSADGRTIIWLHPNVQVDQLSSPGLRQQIEVVGEASENRNIPESTSTDSAEQKDEESLMGMATELTKKQAVSNEDVHLADVGDTVVVEQTEDIVISNLEELCQAVNIATTSKECFKEIENPTAKGTDAGQRVTLTSPQKIIVSHVSSSHKPKKESSRKRSRYTQEDILVNKSRKKETHHRVDSPERVEILNGEGTSKISGELPKEDSFDHFGKYIAALLRNLPSRKSAFRMQKEMLNWVLKEQMLYEQ